MEIKSPPPCPSTVTIRRNPHRRARPTPSTNPPECPHPSSSSNSNVPKISSFPVQDILSMEIPRKPQPGPLSPTSSPSSQTLKVCLRIRPSVPPENVVDPNLKKRHKIAWPRNPAAKKTNTREEKKSTKKNSTEVCISVNDSQSVTLAPPPSLQESKRMKSEVYRGFSHVFCTDSSQNEVYERLMKPLVDDFLNGKNGLLAALGPSGSGKTYTVFGTPREPGMVPLALQKIFGQSKECGSKLSRSFSMSIFEIYSERGKVERISDLSPDGGADLSFQQSNIKGLQEVAVSDAAQAESLIACAMLKRATAMTNSNIQSSRSQCVINIHCSGSKCCGELGVQQINSVLTIVDLAGAEREKKTGNQGPRLLESNFINNTSMIFSLSLRSLLEHQKNPKKPLEKHFQNSLLTRYLRDYLEGKKRMTLILTVKPGEEDYIETTNLLRQASPFMNIRFNNVEDSTNLVPKKRPNQMLSTSEHPKRMKYNGVDANLIEQGKCNGDEPLFLEDVCTKGHQRIHESDSIHTASVNSNSIGMTTERSHQIMQNFAKALLNVLKQYRGKLMVAEREIQSLNENLGHMRTKNLELAKELEHMKLCCTCSKEKSVEAISIKVDTKFEGTVDLEGTESSNVDKTLDIKEVQQDNSPAKCDWTPRQDQDVVAEINASIHFPYLNASVCNGTPERCDLTPRCDQDEFSQIKVSICPSNLNSSEGNGTPKKCYSTARCNRHVISEAAKCDYSPKNCDSSPRKDQHTAAKELLDPPSSQKEDVALIQQCNTDVPESETRFDTSCKSLNFERPRRRLLPASSLLLRDITSLDIENEPQKQKGNGGGKKLAADAAKRTQGNTSLLRLLRNNHL